MTGSVKSKHASADSSVFGLMLMLGYLGFDGFTSTFQDKLFKVRPTHSTAAPRCYPMGLVLAAGGLALCLLVG